MNNIEISIGPDGRRTYYIDIGDLPADKVKDKLEEIKRKFLPETTIH